jgi:hypothetical protein
VQPAHFNYGGGAAYSVFNPLVGLAVLIAGLLICALPRKYIIVPFLVAGLLIPMDQVIVMGPFHFYMLRVLILFGWLRLLTMKLSSNATLFSGGMNAIDKALILSTGIASVNFLLLWQQFGAFINQLGTVYTVFGIYFLLRFLIRDEDDVDRVIRVLAYLSVVIAMVMLLEQATGHSLYDYLGGTRAKMGYELMERDGRFRSQAGFGHAILAGVFGATIFPVFLGLRWKTGKHRLLMLVGMIAATVIVITSVSSTPLLAYLGALLALCLWPLRKQMRPIRWGIVASLVSLQIVMKAPVWALIARVDVISGSSGWHRYYLVDQFIRRFGDWWLIGTKGNAAWGWDMWDIANQYVGIGESSGLLPFLFFVAILVYAFKYLGKMRKSVERNKRQELFIWAMSAALFAHAVAFFGISYWDQTMVLWYAFLAMISAATYQVWRSPVTQLQTAVASTSRCVAYPYSPATAVVKSVRLPNT